MADTPVSEGYLSLQASSVCRWSGYICCKPGHRAEDGHVHTIHFQPDDQ